MAEQKTSHIERYMVAIGLVVLVALGWYYHAVVRATPSVGSGPAGPAVPAEPFAHVWGEGDTVLLGVGDSITRGFGASAGRSYFELLQANDDAACPDMAGRDLRCVFPKLKAVNVAVNYSTSVDHVQHQVPGIKPFGKDVKGIVVITSGGNDLLHPYGRKPPEDGAMYGCSIEQAKLWQPTLRKRLFGIVARASARFPGGCHVFLANVYDPTDGVGDIHRATVPLPEWPDGLEVLALVNRTIADVCAAYEKVHLVEIHALFLGHGMHCRDRANRHYRPDDPHYWYFENLEDPNDRGYDAVRRAFLLAMIEVFHKTRDE